MSVIHPLPRIETLAQAQRTYVRYRDDVEVREAGEEQLFDDIIATMRHNDRAVEARYGHAVRASHAKSHGLAGGELRVADGLPDELRQGMFAEPRSYPVIVRLAQAPGELVDDRNARAPRGMAIKVLEVAGKMLPGHEGRSTHDFLLASSAVFSSAGPKEFLASLTHTATSAHVPEGLARVLSLFARASAIRLNKSIAGKNPQAGAWSEICGLNPLAESYFSQTPCRYGDYIAKIRVTPVMPRRTGAEAAAGNDANALRTAVGHIIRRYGAEFEVAVQLCTNLRDMPVEDARLEWPEHASPYRVVARLLLPPQNAYSAARQKYVDETLSFCPAHALQAHRPLGGINRARLKAYGIMAGLRRIHNRVAINEPRSIGELPA